MCNENDRVAAAPQSATAYVAVVGSIIARTSVTKFKGARLDVREIGAALNVGSILEGSVRVLGDAARINVNLVDVRSQKTIWSHSTRPVTCSYSRLCTRG